MAVTNEKDGVLLAAPSKPLSLTGNVLLLGGAGYIGRAMLKEAHEAGWDARFTVLSRDEQKQETVHQRWPDVRLVLGDICDRHRLADIMWGHDIVVHMAAMKYIPPGEFNVDECVRINLDGSRYVIECARQAQVARVVALSTDKAVSPLNVYGATKMLMERLFIEADLSNNGRPTGGVTRYTVVRYGNVVGSTGSLVQVLRKSIQDQHRVVLTAPQMTRFWITYNDALDLICAATQVDERGVIVIPNPKACSLSIITDELVSMYSGGKLIETKIIGRRPGEKLSEQLINEHESLRIVHGDHGNFWLLPPGRSGDATEPYAFDSSFATQMSHDELQTAILESMTI